MGAQSRRRHYFIDSRFQVNHIVSFAVFAAIVALIVGGFVAYLFLFELPKTRVEQEFWGSMFLWNLLWMILALVVIACVRSVFISHKIVGPMYRLKQIMRAVGEGDLTHRVRFRTRDRLKDVGEACDEMIVGLRNRVSADRSSAARIAQVAKHAQAVLSTVELGPDRVQQVRDLLEEIAGKADSITANYKTD
jgi:methyl-accepting chemotaxis protein